jgi:hypothetical protein
MASSQSAVSCCNLALLSIGARAQVSSITPSDGSTAADACATLFSFVFQQLARTARWGCLNKQVTMTLIQAAQGTPENPTGTTLPLPQQPWLYGYLYPPDCLLMRQIFPPITSTGSTPNQTSLNNNVAPVINTDYQIRYTTGYSTDTSGNPLEVVFTNQENAVGNYIINQQNPSSWDSLFTSAFVASLAAYLVPALSLNPPLMQSQIAIAERMINQARAMDANEGTYTQDHVPDFIRARSGATGVLMGGIGYAAYGTMNWPSW